MAKITLTLDDSAPAMVAAFGENAIEKLSDAMGYQTKVEVPKDELPEVEMIEVETNEGMIERPRDYTVDELYKDNPQSREEFVSAIVIKRGITPILLENAKRDIERQVQAQTQEKVAQLEAVLESSIVKEIK